MLELKNVHSYYGRSHALHGIDLRVPAGQVTAVLGRNGMGKTTLLRTLVGSLVHSTGAILLDGADIAARPTHLRARAGIAYVPQGREIIPDFTVRQNILMGAFARQGPRECRRWRWSCFPTWPRTSTVPAACCPAASSSNWRSPGRWPPRRR